jgi:multiple sugar transport system permease protein
MKTRTFAAFVAPSLVMMLVFIAAPLVYVFGQSFYLTTPVTEQVTVETCTPGFLVQNCSQETRSQPKLDEAGRIVTQTQFVGLQSYAAILEPAKAWAAVSSLDYRALMAIDFWRALRFTLMFTFVTLPLVLVLGLSVALAVNNTAKSLRGPVIFVSLLPFIITPVVGALSIRWLFVSDGLLNHGIEWLLGHPVSMFSQGWTIEILMILYRVWAVAPFAFIILYAGLQTLNSDAIEAAMIDGASRWQRLRYVIVPHLTPLIIFVALIHLMDAYRVFDEIVGFRADAHVISLQYLTYDFLIPDSTGNRSISRAAASSMLTMIGIVLLLIPLLRQTWTQHRGAR